MPNSQKTNPPDPLQKKSNLQSCQIAKDESAGIMGPSWAWKVNGYGEARDSRNLGEFFGVEKWNIGISVA